MKNIFIYGAGGVGREIILLINDINEVKNKWNILGFIDDNKDMQGKMKERNICCHGHCRAEDKREDSE